jgi:hypothetical protein
MLSMIYTKTNRYNIDNKDLEKFYQIIKENTFTINFNGKDYKTDGYTLYEVDEFNKMINKEIYPFPEHLSLKINKKIIHNKSLDQIKYEIADIFIRPKLKNNIFD